MMGEVLGLLPCPLCGREAEIERYGDRRKSTIYVCTNCGCSLETGEEWGHGRDWNKRVPPREMEKTMQSDEKYPRGKLNDEDEGALSMAITVANERLIIDFGKPVVWIGFGKEEALALATLIQKRCEEL